MGALELIFILSFFLFYVITVIFLKPFRIHRKRKYSTIALKVSYLLYLAVFLLFLYLLIFVEKDETVSFSTKSEVIFNPFFLLFLVSAIIPNVGIMIRRQIKKKRFEYNVFASVANILFFAYLLILIVVQEYTRF
jgi:uncharacterized membrane protein YidH (DUF202 family)